MISIINMNSGVKVLFIKISGLKNKGGKMQRKSSLVEKLVDFLCFGGFIIILLGLGLASPAILITGAILGVTGLIIMTVSIIVESFKEWGVLRTLGLLIIATIILSILLFATMILSDIDKDGNILGVILSYGLVAIPVALLTLFYFIFLSGLLLGNLYDYISHKLKRGSKKS